MAKIVPLNPQLMRGRSFALAPNYSFAADISVCEINRQEAISICRRLPIGFLKNAATDRFELISVLGLQPKQNLVVAPNGHWLSDVIPTSIRLYPFSLQVAENQKLVLCIDLESGLIVDGEDGKPLFDENGATPLTQEIFQILVQHSQQKGHSSTSIESLQKYQLIVPWDLEYTAVDSSRHRIDGLYKINESALQELNADALIELRDTGSLALAYCQMVSMHNISYLEQLLKVRGRALERLSSETPISLNADNDSLNFDSL